MQQVYLGFLKEKRSLQCFSRVISCAQATFKALFRQDPVCYRNAIDHHCIEEIRKETITEGTEWLNADSAVGCL